MPDALKFDDKGNLLHDVIFTAKQFKQFFGYNKTRKKKIADLFAVAEKFKNIGCEMMFVFGTFVTQKENPGDIDVCFDISNVAAAVLEKIIHRLTNTSLPGLEAI